MSKHDFTPDEFADRRSRVRAAVAAAGLDWLVAFHPVSIHWLTGSDAKSYQEFQCLLIPAGPGPLTILRSEEHTSELQSLMRISYAVFCLKKKNKKHLHHNPS